MGRKSKLTDAQWAEIDRRIIEGDSIRSLAREFGIAESTIRERIAKHGRTETVHQVARKLVDAQESLAALPLPAQITAQNLAAKLRSISDNLAAAANYGAMTAHRLQALANSEVQKVDDATPLDSLEALKGVSLLTKLANDSAATGIGLLQANKEAIQRANAEKDVDEDARARAAGLAARLAQPDEAEADPGA